MKFEGKNIGIVGLGKSGYWASKLAKNLHYNVFVSDTNSNIDTSMIDDLENLGVETELGKHTNKILKVFTIITEGFPPLRFFLKDVTKDLNE